MSQSEAELSRPGPAWAGRPGRMDFIVAVVLAATAFFGTLHAARHLGDPVTWPGIDSSWFEADTRDFRVLMTTRSGSTDEVRLHPLLPMVAYPPVKIIDTLGAPSTMEAIRITLALMAGVWIVAILLLLRVARFPLPDAAVFSALSLASAAYIFFTPVPESYTFGSLSIVLTLTVMAAADHRRLAPAWFVGASAVSLSMTITNWMFGILAAFLHFPWKKAAAVTLAGLAVVLAFWGAQKIVFPESYLFLDIAGAMQSKSDFVLTERAGGPAAVAGAVLFHPLVVPAITERPDPGNLWLVVQGSTPGSGGPWGLAGVGCWTVLLALGVWGALSTARLPGLRSLVALGLAGQGLLHLLYGEETFLYSLHFLPLLIMLAAFGTLTRARPLVLVLATCLVLFAAVNNWTRFYSAAGRIHAYAEELDRQGLSPRWNRDLPPEEASPPR